MENTETQTPEAEKPASAASQPSEPEKVASAQATQRDLSFGDQEAAKPPAADRTENPQAAQQAQQLQEAIAKMQDLEAVIAGLQNNIEANKGQIEVNKAAMRESVLSGLHVLDKYRSFAPDVDPFTEEGKQALETWAKENPELLAKRPKQVVDVDTGKFKEKMRSPHLVDFKKFSASMKGG